jgi:hypothetical protein
MSSSGSSKSHCNPSYPVVQTLNICGNRIRLIRPPPFSELNLLVPDLFKLFDNKSNATKNINTNKNYNLKTYYVHTNKKTNTNCIPLNDCLNYLNDHNLYGRKKKLLHSDIKLQHLLTKTLLQLQETSGSSFVNGKQQKLKNKKKLNKSTPTSISTSTSTTLSSSDFPSSSNSISVPSLSLSLPTSAAGSTRDPLFHSISYSFVNPASLYGTRDCNVSRLYCVVM